MRFQQFVQEIVLPVEMEQYKKSVNLAANVNGGWEGWLQVEFFFKLQEVLTDDRGLCEFNREVKYPNSTLIADFNFVPCNADDSTTWVELKTQKKDNYKEAVKAFEQDYIKILDVDTAGIPNDTLGALVVIPSDAKLALQYAKDNNFKYEESVICYIVYADHWSSSFGLYDSWPDTDGALVMYIVRNP